MPYRKVPFINKEYFHVYNRGVNKRKIFLTASDYIRGIETINYYSYSGHTQRFSYYSRLSDSNKDDYFNQLGNPIVEIVAFVFMPNHFHFLLSQQEENGISNFMRLFQNSYTRYFNPKHQRIGHLFQGQFKSVHVVDNAQLLHVSRYIHLNPLSSHIVHDIPSLEKYSWSSYPGYLKAKLSQGFVQNRIIMEQLDNQTYQSFVNENSLRQQELDDIKHLTLE